MLFILSLGSLNNAIIKICKKYATAIKSRLYSGEISEEIFTENMVILIEPICHSAKNLGFMEWVNRGFITVL